MKKFLGSHQSFLVAALIIAFVTNNTNCIRDGYCDPDPIYGGCPSSCEWAGWGSFLGKSIGFFFLLELGSFLGQRNLENKEELKKLMRKEVGFKWTAEQVLKEIESEQKEENKRIDQMLRTIEAKENKKKKAGKF